jgi:hypothetical protein
MGINLKKALLPVAAVASLVATIATSKPAQAYQSYEHEVSDFGFPSNLTQAQADSGCRSAVFWRINGGGGLFHDSSHGKNLSFVVGSNPYAWANLSAGRCVINATWGYWHW